jgi:N utilization substance protein B
VGKRRQARELALQFLFQCDLNPPRPSDDSKGKTPADTHPAEITSGEGHEDTLEGALATFWEHFKTDEDVKPFFRELVLGVMENRDAINQIINETSENWKIDRMSAVDRNILRFSVFEILFLDDIPENVTINEAIEIAKRYGTGESPAFINGILDKIAGQKKGR